MVNIHKEFFRVLLHPRWFRPDFLNSKHPMTVPTILKRLSQQLQGHTSAEGQEIQSQDTTWAVF